jgi:hypothetical protein
MPKFASTHVAERFPEPRFYTLCPATADDQFLCSVLMPDPHFPWQAWTKHQQVKQYRQLDQRCHWLFLPTPTEGVYLVVNRVPFNGKVMVLQIDTGGIAYNYLRLNAYDPSNSTRWLPYQMFRAEPHPREPERHVVCWTTVRREVLSTRWNQMVFQYALNPDDKQQWFRPSDEAVPVQRIAQPPYRLQTDYAAPLDAADCPAFEFGRAPSEAGKVLIGETMVPFTSVHEQGVDPTDQLEKAPFYKLKRYQCFQKVFNRTNDTTDAMQIDETYKVEITKETETEFRRSLSIHIGTKAEFKPLDAAGLTLGFAMSETRGTTLTRRESVKEEVTYTEQVRFTLKPGRDRARYQVFDSYELCRPTFGKPGKETVISQLRYAKDRSFVDKEATRA